MLCFTCYDHTQFQLYGTISHANAFKALHNIETDTIHCELCDRTVKFEKQDGKWDEIEIPK